ncbi:mesothelin-like [Dendropsophus ebraccatus]|uniref:mesothelin-like n=1 Tax=Dendropsophus ebraccatus TaxID=150705 RepID=UPI0038317F8B
MNTLSTISGWSVTQASAIVTKVIENNYQINVQTLQTLGSLAIGVPSSKITSLTPTDILALASNSTFSTFMEQAPAALRQKFVQEVIQASSNKSIFQSVPPNLASEIPASKLLTSTLNVSEINQMKWTTSQAQVFFRIVLVQITNYSMLSSNILQGFTCGAANNLNNTQFVSLIKSMTGKSVNLDSSQLSCLAMRLTTNGLPKDFASYSSEVLLYLGPYTSPSECVDYFTRVGEANINLLDRGSAKRVNLLKSARTCLNIYGTSKITNGTLQKLGSLACDLTAQEITNSESYIIQALKSCAPFTDSQKSAILQKLKATYGDPSTWTISTMGQIGNLTSTIDTSTLQRIPKTVRVNYFSGFLTQIKVQYKLVFISVIKQLKVSSRLTARAAPDGNVITTDMINKQKDYLVISYTAAELDQYLSNTTLKDNLEILGSLAFDNDQLTVLKNKLDTIFPTTVPEQYLLQIGNIAMMYSTEEISRWSITSVDTLSVVLHGASWETNNMKINALVKQYLNSPNATLDGTTLTVVAPYICGLNETLIQIIPASVLRISSQPLDTSTCTQNQKDLLYSKMAAAYSSSDNSSNSYFQIMKTVIGGSKSSDLILFAKGLPEMDLNTFTELNPNEVKKLTAGNIKDLLGINSFDINSIINSSALQAWVSVNPQTEINKLGLNATGGIQETMPDGFIDISPVIETSGASSHTFVYLFYACTFAVIYYINSPIL